MYRLLPFSWGVQGNGTGDQIFTKWIVGKLSNKDGMLDHIAVEVLEVTKTDVKNLQGCTDNMIEKIADAILAKKVLLRWEEVAATYQFSCRFAK